MYKINFERLVISMFELDCREVSKIRRVNEIYEEPRFVTVYGTDSLLEIVILPLIST